MITLKLIRLSSPSMSLPTSSPLGTIWSTSWSHPFGVWKVVLRAICSGKSWRADKYNRTWFAMLQVCGMVVPVVRAFLDCQFGSSFACHMLRARKSLPRSKISFSIFVNSDLISNKKKDSHIIPSNITKGGAYSYLILDWHALGPTCTLVQQQYWFAESRMGDDCQDKNVKSALNSPWNHFFFTSHSSACTQKPLSLPVTRWYKSPPCTVDPHSVAEWIILTSYMSYSLSAFKAQLHIVFHSFRNKYFPQNLCGHTFWAW